MPSPESLPRQPEKTSELSQALELRFENDLTDKRAGDFDVVTWNLYQLLIRMNVRLGLRGEKAWRKAHNDARRLRDQLKSTKVANSSGEEVNFTLFQSLFRFATRKNIKFLRLRPDLHVEFVGRDGAVLERFHIYTLEKAVIQDTARAERYSLLQEIGRFFEAVSDFPRKAADNLAELAEKALRPKLFEPLLAPKIPEFRPQKTVSAVDGIRLTHIPPRIIEQQFRHLDVCSAYVLRLLQQSHGRTAIIEAGFYKYQKFVDAWDLKAQGLQNDSVEIHASTVSALRQDKKGRRPILEIADRKVYLESVSGFFRAADQGHYPALLTVFLTNTEYARQIWKTNERRLENLRSYNSHVVVALGREEVQTREVNRNISLSSYFEKEFGIKPDFQGFLNIRMERSNGGSLEISENGQKAILRRADGTVEDIGQRWKNFSLKKGDKIFFQDVLISDFYKGQERVMGLAQFASKREVILMDYMTLKNAKPRVHPEYSVTGYFQLTGTGSVIDQMKQQGFSSEEIPYYLAAFADSGIDLNSVRSGDLLPRFDFAKLREVVDRKGGPAEIRRDIVRSNGRQYVAENPGSIMIEIQAGKTPWEHFRSFFESYFLEKHALTSAEKILILRAVDDSCPNIDLFATPPRFEAGAFVYLNQSRIAEIVRLIYQKQSEIFSEQDYVKIIEKGDSPVRFLRECFMQEVALQNLKLTYDQLDSVERQYLWKAFVVCNPQIDLTLVDRGKFKQWKDFREGVRMFFRKNELLSCISDIVLKRSLQGPEPEFTGHGSNLRGRESAIYERKEIPVKILNCINRIYPGNSLEDTFVRSALYYVFTKEQLGGTSRAALKAVKDRIFGGVRSRGLFQLRVLPSDMENCRSKFEELGYKMPSNFEEFRKWVVQYADCSTIVAGERIRQSLRSFGNFMELNSEDPSKKFDQNFAIMLVTSYNRAPANIYRAVFQNWAYNLAQAAGVSSDVVPGPGGIDSLAPDAGRLQELQAQVLNTFRRVFVKLRDEGKIHFDGDCDSVFSKIFSSHVDFLKSDLFQQMKLWYERTTGQKLSFVFTTEELKRGDSIFSYGRRYLYPGHDFIWQATFRDQKRLKELYGKMKGSYQLQPFQSSPPSLPEALTHSEKVVAQKPSEDIFEKTGIRSCFEDGKEGILTVYGKEVNLRDAPGIHGKHLGSICFGNQLKILGVENVSGDIWIRVRILTGRDSGKEGYMAFEKEWFSNEKGPELAPAFSERLERLEDDGEKPLPYDYRIAMERYARFIDNLNPNETPRTLRLMNSGLATATEVLDTSVSSRVYAIARHYGYTNQKFFAILPKVSLGGLRGQKLFVIDTAGNRIISFSVSTGRPSHETPAGQYTAYSQGFRDLNYLGAHMGSYARKYARLPRIERFQAGRGSGPISMTTALIEIRGGERSLQRQRGAGRYLHGTNRENHLGEKASSGCIRMANLDSVYLAALLNGEQMEFRLLDNLDPKLVRQGITVGKS